MKTFQTAWPYELRLDSMRIPFETEAEAMELEKRIHASLQIYRLRGEWFDCDAATATKAAISVVASDYEVDDAGVCRKINK